MLSNRYFGRINSAPIVNPFPEHQRCIINFSFSRQSSAEVRKPRHSKFVVLREDKNPRDVVKESLIAAVGLVLWLSKENYD